MKRWILRIGGVALLGIGFGSAANAAPYAVSVRSATAAILIPVGTDISHVFTITNSGSNADTYDLSLSSKMGWVVESSIPAAVSISPGSYRDISMTLNVPATTDRSARDTVLLQARSRGNVDLRADDTVDIQLQGAPPVALITGPDTGATGEQLTFTFTGLPFDSLAQREAFTYEIDWDGDLTVDKRLRGVAGGEITHYTFPQAGSFIIRLKATSNAFGGSAEVTHPIAISGEAAAEWQKKLRRTLLRIEDNPCASLRGLYLSSCLMNIRKGKKTEETSTEKRKERLREAIRQREGGRRLAALKAGRLHRESAILSRIQPKGRIDLSPRGIRERPVTQGLTEMRGGLSIMRRTKAGTRKSAQAIPLCARRSGLLLINCLLELGIDINERTADFETLEIWKRMQDGD